MTRRLRRLEPLDPKAVHHRGAFGIEPITYVLDDSAEAAATLAVAFVNAAANTSE